MHITGLYTPRYGIGTMGNLYLSSSSAARRE